MNIYVNTLLEGKIVKAVYFLSDIGSFYAEPINDGLIGEGLLYNDLMFHFEGNESRTEVILKDSENHISDAINGWLQNHSNMSFVTNNKETFDAIAKLININLDNYHTVIVGTDKTGLPVIEKTKKLKDIYDAKG